MVARAHNRIPHVGLVSLVTASLQIVLDTLLADSEVFAMIVMTQ